MKGYQTIIANSWPVVKREARRRRRRREWKIVGVIVAPVVVAAVIVFGPGGSKSGQDEIAKAPAVSETPLSVEISEEGLLEQLADQGPILVEQEDGTKKLILTRPKRLTL